MKILVLAPQRRGDARGVPATVSLFPNILHQADVLVSPRLKGLNTPMKTYSYLDSGVAVLATRLRSHTQVLGDRSAKLGRFYDGMEARATGAKA